MVKFITEKEFVPAYVTRGSGWTNEAEKGLYQIVYGVLQHYMAYEDIYDLIVRISREQESEVVKRFKLQAWLDEVKSIINRIEKLNIKDNSIMVYIPFTYYYDNLRSTLGRFELVRFIIEEILSKGDNLIKLSSSPQYDYPIEALDLLIENYRNKVMDNLSNDEMDNCLYYNELIDDELIRRGHKLTVKYLFDFDSDSGMIVHTDHTKLTELSPSKNYKRPEKFFELNHFNEKCNMLKVKIEDDSDDDNSDGAPEKKVNQKEMTGIIYFMLRDIFKDAFEKRNNNKLVGLIHYILDDMFPKKHLQKDTVRRYMSDFSKNIFDRKFCETVEKVLKESGFNVPKEIKV
jgi:hypothetical protein